MLFGKERDLVFLVAGRRISFDEVRTLTRQSALAGLQCRVRVRGQTGARGNGIYDLSKTTFRPELGEDEMITEAIATTIVVDSSNYDV